MPVKMFAGQLLIWITGLKRQAEKILLLSPDTSSVIPDVSHLRCHQTGVSPSVDPPAVEGQFEAQILCQTTAEVSDHQSGTPGFEIKTHYSNVTINVIKVFSQCWLLSLLWH